MSGCCKHNHVIHAAELIRHFPSLLLPAAPPLAWITWRIWCCCERVCAENLPLCCACVKGRLWVNCIGNSLDFTQRSCLKAALDWPAQVTLKHETCLLLLASQRHLSAENQQETQSSKTPAVTNGERRKADTIPKKLRSVSKDSGSFSLCHFLSGTSVTS